MMDKTISSFAEAVEDVRDGASMMISGFGGAGLPVHLIEAVLDAGVKELTIISNNAGSKGLGIAKLVKAGRVRKVICSFPRQPGSDDFDQVYRKGKLELEIGRASCRERVCQYV